MAYQMTHSGFSTLDKELLQLIETRKESLQKALEQKSIDIEMDEEYQVELNRVLLCSEFIFSYFISNPDVLKKLFMSKDILKSYSKHTYQNRIEEMLSGETKEISDVRQALLGFKLYEIIRIAWRDLTRKAELEEILKDLSTLACAVLDAALGFIYRSECLGYGTPVDHEGNFQRLIILGMGKLGAEELNFSSDLDLIFVYPETGYTNGENIISNEEFFNKVCRKLLDFFSKKQQGQHFYRVDTRLRPYGESGPLVMSCSAFEEYYQAQGREWERYAMIKAKPVAGDIEAGHRLLNILNSFIYRRYFDYGSFDSFRDMKNRISLQVKNKRLKNNIKLGEGGIREIEFFGQLFQLIRGGVEPELQERKILKVLDLLCEGGSLEKSAGEDLKDAYRYLRLVENRLQIHSDLQTHDIPEKDQPRNILAFSMGYDSFDAFDKDLKQHLNTVHHHFMQLLAADEEKHQDTETTSLKELWMNINDPQFKADADAVRHFENPERILNMLRSLENHPNTKRLTPNGRKKLSSLIPVMLKKICSHEAPESIFVKLIDLVITIERRTCYLSLLIENQAVLETLIAFARKSPWIVSFLSKHPALLDELIHPETLYFPPGIKDLEKEIKHRLVGIPFNDLEFLLEQLCIFRQINHLRVAAADISGNYPLMKVSDHLTYIAETILSQVLAISWNIMKEKYGIPEGVSGKDPDDCGFAVIVYGKVGGFEMGYKSDIDIVFIYNAESGVTAGGRKSIESIRFYSNLGQRIVNALTMHTPAGNLYGADMRLRPGGSSGMIVSHVDMFEDYIMNQAWTWEHQALIRARPIAGDKYICRRFNEIRHAALTRKREPLELKKEVSDMRERMRRERMKTVKDGFHLKQSRGGIVDIEFLVQFLVLENASRYPEICRWTDNVRLIESLNALGIIRKESAVFLKNTYLEMRKTIHRLNLQESSSQVEEMLFKEEAQKVKALYDEFLGCPES